MRKIKAMTGDGKVRELVGVEAIMYKLNNGNIIWYYTPRQSGKKYRTFKTSIEAIIWMSKHLNYTYDLMSRSIYNKYKVLLNG